MTIINNNSFKVNKDNNKNNTEHLSFNLSGNIVTVKNYYSALPLNNLKSRQQINRFSTSSSQRMQKYLRECASDYKTMITLTYPKISGFNGKQAKKDLDLFIKHLKRKFNVNDSFSVFWFMEFQERGAIHYHLYTTLDFIPYEWLASDWNNIVFNGIAKQLNLSNVMLDNLEFEKRKHLQAGTRVEKLKYGKAGLASYARKYASKQNQKIVPKDFGFCGRFWGVYGNRKRDKVAKATVNDVLLANQAINDKTIEIAKILNKHKKLKKEHNYTVYVINDKTMFQLKSLINELNELINIETNNAIIETNKIIQSIMT